MFYLVCADSDFYFYFYFLANVWVALIWHPGVDWALKANYLSLSLSLFGDLNARTGTANANEGILPDSISDMESDNGDAQKQYKIVS